MARAKKQPDNETQMATETSPAPVAEKAPSQGTAATPSRRPRRRTGSWLLVLALVAVSAWAYSLYRENRELRDPEAQAKRIVAGMSRHIILPEGEVPGIFPIDKAQAEEPFFKNAEDGDLLVVYRSTQQAFIYSPSRKILVNAGVLMVNPEQEKVPAAAPAEAEPAPEEEA